MLGPITGRRHASYIQAQCHVSFLGLSVIRAHACGRIPTALRDAFGAPWHSSCWGKPYGASRESVCPLHDSGGGDGPPWRITPPSSSRTSERTWPRCRTSGRVAEAACRVRSLHTGHARNGVSTVSRPSNRAPVTSTYRRFYCAALMARLGRLCRRRLL